MFQFIEKMFTSKSIVKKTPFTKEYREGYNRHWIQALKDW